MLHLASVCTPCCMMLLRVVGIWCIRLHSTASLQHGHSHTQHCWRSNFGNCCVRLHVALAIQDPFLRITKFCRKNYLPPPIQEKKIEDKLKTTSFGPIRHNTDKLGQWRICCGKSRAGGQGRPVLSACSGADQSAGFASSCPLLETAIW